MNLFGKEPRPTFNEEMRKELSKNIALQVYEWLCGKGKSLQEVTEDTEEVLKNCHGHNGYSLAKEFEEKGYCPDSDLVSILDYVAYEENNILEENTKRWVVDNSIEPEFLLSDKILVERRGKKVEGTITGTYTATAEYVVCILSEGHSLEEGTTRAIVKYEDAEKITKKTIA